MRLKNCAYYFKEASKGVLRNGWMTVASVTVVILTMLILGSFVAINLNIQQFTEEIKHQVEIVAYIDESLMDEEQIEELRAQVLAIPGVQQLTYVDKETALERLRERLGEQAGITDALEDRNPLDGSFEIRAHNPEHIPQLAEQVSRLAGIESVDYGQEVVDNLFRILNVVQLFSFAVISVLGVMALFLIANTIKLTVFARRKQIGIMKYVGATDWFIRWPFILEGVILGVLGAGATYLILFYIYSYFYVQASTWLYQNFLSVTMVPPELVGMELLKILFALGAGIGGLGSGISVRKFLQV